MKILQEENILKLKYDSILNIAIGRSRKETNWKNIEIKWSRFVNKLSKTKRTEETYEEYINFKKEIQDEIKDIGGFVGGYINNGRRKVENITYRQLITLDIDFGNKDIWENYKLLYGNSAVFYSTHKHCKDKERYRLIIPLDREVPREEYEAISRKIAGDLGIDAFDDTTFQAERLMYFPSTAKDGEYIFEYIDEKWISADSVLNLYSNWQNTSLWPVSKRQKINIKKEVKNQKDPLKKEGLVGSFCRSYTIEEAINEFLKDIYEPFSKNRYTYKNGSTVGGLVIYENKFAYSHHSTDPLQGKLCNAFDLVRIHKFGIEDINVKENIPTNKLVSYKNMIEFISKNSKVKKELINRKLENIKDDFGNFSEEKEEDLNWIEELDIDKKGKIKQTIDNVVKILRNDKDLKNKLGLNEFEHREILKGSLPWRKYDKKDPYLQDSDDSGIRHFLERKYNLTTKQKIDDGLKLVMKENAIHPVKEYLDNLKWDGKIRLENILIDYLGAESNEYVKAVTRKLLAGAVARIYNPGCKFDYILVLVGKQGIGKSSLIKKLGKEWFSDSLQDIKGKEAYEQLQGVWIMEIAELSSFKKAEVEQIKHFVSKQEDRYRVAYGKRTENFPRQCVFFGTTNTKEFLQDETGNRRFWPVDCYVNNPKCNWQDIDKYEIDQIWAEAKYLYEKKEPLYLDKKLESIAAEQQEDHLENNDKVGMIKEYLDLLVPKNWADMDIYERRRFLESDDLEENGEILRERICVAEIYCELFKGDKKELTPYISKQYHNIMKKMSGWGEYLNGKKLRFGKEYGVQKAYIRLDKNGKNSVTKSVTKANFSATLVTF